MVGIRRMMPMRDWRISSGATKKMRMRMRMRMHILVVDTTDDDTDDDDDNDDDGRSLKDRCWATHTNGNEAM